MKLAANAEFPQILAPKSLDSFSQSNQKIYNANNSQNGMEKVLGIRGHKAEAVSCCCSSYVLYFGDLNI